MVKLMLKKEEKEEVKRLDRMDEIQREEAMQKFRKDMAIKKKNIEEKEARHKDELKKLCFNYPFNNVPTGAKFWA